MVRWALALIGIGLALALTGEAVGQPGPEISPADLARQIEQRAQKSSFAGLSAFGEEAARRRDREGLRRLQHVINVFQAQSEMAKATRFNGILFRNASQLHDDRYIAVAKLNEISMKYDDGDGLAAQHLEWARKSETDWYAKVFADTLWAKVLIDRRDTGDALQLLLKSEQSIPAQDADSVAAEASIWEIMGIGLMRLNDLGGAAKAFHRSQFEFADPAYPRPDFDAVYNLGHMAIDMGDRKTAAQLFQVHHKLATRSDLPHLDAWDANLCAMYAEAFDPPQNVLNCLDRMKPDLAGAEFLGRSILPMRAIAEARLGKLGPAREDLARLQRLAETSDMGKAVFSRIDEVEAEILRAEGHNDVAFERLREYDRKEAGRRAQEVYGGVRQITGSLQTQLETARHDTKVEARAVRNQRFVIIMGVSLFLGGAVVVLLQLRNTRRLASAHARAEEANAAKSAFLATMSHEIRTPLNGVLGMAQSMSAEKLSPSQREKLTIIRESGEALLSILNDVLDLSKIEAGKLDLEIVDFDLSEVARGAHAAFSAIAKKKGLAFTLNVEQAKGRYHGDPTRIRQILSNFISNGLKFTDEGEIRVIATYTEGVLTLSVADTGGGISAENLPKLFERFDQLDSSTTRRFGGTGLGLSICRELAQLMGGEITVRSKLGEGSLFTLTLPLHRQGDERGAAAPKAEQDEIHPVELRVLAAEDNSVNQLVLKTLLQPLGVHPHVVEDGQAAVEAWASGEWDVILMDVQMPVMDGLTATRIIRDREARLGRARTPIIALTANAMSHQVAEYQAAGMDGHIAKPIEAGALFAALSSIAGAEADDEAEAA